MINRTLSQMIDLMGFDPYSIEVIAFDAEDKQGIWRGFNKSGEYCELVIDMMTKKASVMPLGDSETPSGSQKDVDALVDDWRQDRGLSRAAAYRHLAMASLKRTK